MCRRCDYSGSADIELLSDRLLECTQARTSSRDVAKKIRGQPKTLRHLLIPIPRGRIQQLCCVCRGVLVDRSSCEKEINQVGNHQQACRGPRDSPLRLGIELKQRARREGLAAGALKDFFPRHATEDDTDEITSVAGRV